MSDIWIRWGSLALSLCRDQKCECEFSGIELFLNFICKRETKVNSKIVTLTLRDFCFCLLPPNERFEEIRLVFCWVYILLIINCPFFLPCWISFSDVSVIPDQDLFFI